MAANIRVVVSLSPVRGPGPRATRIAAIGATWGRRLRVAILVCAAHEDAPASREAAREAGMAIWELPPREHSPRFSQFRALKFAVQQTSEEWLFWANDHTFVVAENLACYLSSLDSNRVRYVGSRLWGPCCGVFNSGAAGFALSRKALAALDDEWHRPRERCDPDDDRAHVGTCLLAIDPTYGSPVDTRDPDGAERFNVYGPVRLAIGAVDDWFKNKKRRVHGEVEEYGPDAVSADVVTFHYVAAKETRLLDHLIHHKNDRHDLQRRWPKSPDLGGYAVGWPNRPDKQRLVSRLLDNIQVCRPNDDLVS